MNIKFYMQTYLCLAFLFCTAHELDSPCPEKHPFLCQLVYKNKIIYDEIMNICYLWSKFEAYL